MSFRLPNEYPRSQLAISLPKARDMSSRVGAAADVSVVIPVKDDGDGLGETLAALAVLRWESRPVRVLVVDDGSRDAGAATSRAVAAAASRGMAVQAVIQPVNQGPAAARNAGAALVSTDWAWFLDAGVRPVPDCLDILVRAGQEHDAVAWTGPVLVEDTGPFATYYRAQFTHCPPAEPDGRLQTFVGASVVVNMAAFRFIGGFDPSFRRAACEDFDLGLRLRAHGDIAWVSGLAVHHRFAEDETDFRMRFTRYGFGFWQFGRKWRCDMEPWRVTPNLPDPFSRRLAELQYASLMAGWSEGQLAHPALPQDTLDADRAIDPAMTGDPA